MKRLLTAAAAAAVLTACGTTVPQVTTVAGGGSAGGVSDGLNPQSGTTGAAGTAPATAGTQSGGTGGTTNAGGVGTSSLPTTGNGGTSTTVIGNGPTGTVTASSEPSARASAVPKGPGSKKTTGPTATKTGSGGKSSTPGSSKSTAASAGPTSGRGFTATTIDIGYSDSDLSSYAQTLGVKGVSTGDTKAQITALATYINSHGGVDGRQIVLHEYTYSSAEEASNADQAVDEACAAWTQDDKVFAVVSSSVSTIASGLQCMANADTPVIDANQAGQFLPGIPSYQKYPDILFSPATFTAEKFAQLYVSTMQRTKYLTGWNTTTGAASASTPVKLGILVNNEPGYTYATDQIISALKAAGYPIASSDIITYDDNLSSATSQAEAAVVKFRSDGVTHVVNSDLEFADTAQSQNYFPRYAIGATPEVFAENYTAQQLAGSVAVSATPAIDTDAAHQPPVQNSTQALCEKIMTDAGQDITDLSALALMEGECDEMFALQSALSGAPTISNAALQSGFEKVGAVDCSATFVCQQGQLPSGHASAQAVRDMVYTSSCSCFTYVDNVNHTS